MLADKTSRRVRHEAYTEQSPAPSPEKEIAICPAFNSSIKPVDDTRFSICSDKSDSKLPRSAMRRTSSISKLPQSPRRVRFDFMGEEVLPTSSPQQSQLTGARVSSPEPADDEARCTSSLSTDPGEDDEGPCSQKISSSDALRALSRIPVEEDGTVWTVVNSDSEDSARDESLFTQSHETHDADALPIPKVAPIPPGSQGEMHMLQSQTCSNTTESDTTAHELDRLEDDSTDDEDILSMARPKTSPSLGSRAPGVRAFSISEKAMVLYKAGGGISGTTNSERAGPAAWGRVATSGLVPASDQTEDVVFHFEEDILELPQRASQQQQQDQEQEQKQPEEERGDQWHSDQHIEAALSMTASPYATSPPISIPRQMVPIEKQPLMASVPLTPSNPKFHSSTVGSYKGRPLIMSVLRDPGVVDKILSLEPVIGSVPARVGSIRDTIDEMLAAGPPKSFKERLMIEDMMEAAEASRKSP